MPAQPRKAPVKKTTASVRARREVAAEPDKATFTFTVRGAEFTVPLVRLGNDRMYNLTIAMQEASESMDRIRYMGKIVRYLIGVAEQDRWVGLAKDDELPGALVVDTMQAINKAGNVPNS
jgi:hypothetical protein